MKLFEGRYISIEADEKGNSQNLGSQILELRKELKMNQNDFGKLFSPPATKGIVSKWEHGITVPSPERLFIISELSGKDVETLLYGSLRGAVISVIDNADSYMSDVLNSKTKEEFVYSNGSTDLEKTNFLRHVYDFIIFSENDYFGTKQPSVWKRHRENEKYQDTPSDELEIKKYNQDEYIASRRYFLKNVLPLLKATGVKPYQHSIIMTLLANSAEDHFNNITRTDSGVISALSQGIEEIEGRLSDLTTAGTASGTVNLPNEINPELIRRATDLLAATSDAIDKLQEEYVPNYYHLL